jgi:non-specific serine/threonine protein kinase
MPLDEAIEDALAMVPTPARPADRHLAEDGSRLTPREREVAALIARGLTNQQIADQLVIAKRTAANHVEHILAKLGFRSRVQIAAWASEHGRPDVRTSGRSRK